MKKILLVTESEKNQLPPQKADYINVISVK